MRYNSSVLYREEEEIYLPRTITILNKKNNINVSS